MKVLLHYEDHTNKEYWKTLKITLPKSWKNGPTQQLLVQFIESYNEKFNATNPLVLDQVHLAKKQGPQQQQPSNTTATATTALGNEEKLPIASDAIVIDCISDREDIYIVHGPSQTVEELQSIQEQRKEQERLQKLQEIERNKNMVCCTRFGCQKRFVKGGPYPTTPCIYHKSPPVFHETAKFWSCCPHKKVYDFEEFQNIPGCCTAPTCTDMKDSDRTKQSDFLGGCDIREQLLLGGTGTGTGAASGSSTPTTTKLKSIDDFNKAQAIPGSSPCDAIPILNRLQNVLLELDIDKELYEQVIDIYRLKLQSTTQTDVELITAIKNEMSNAIKSCFKNIVVEHMRIK